MVLRKVGRLGKVENDANVNDHKLPHIKSGHLKGGDVKMNMGNTVVIRMKRTSEKGLDLGGHTHMIL